MKQVHKRNLFSESSPDIEAIGQFLEIKIHATRFAAQRLGDRRSL